MDCGFKCYFVAVNKNFEVPFTFKENYTKEEMAAFCKYVCYNCKAFLLLAGCVATRYRYMSTWASIYRLQQEI